MHIFGRKMKQKGGKYRKPDYYAKSNITCQKVL